MTRDALALPLCAALFFAGWKPVLAAVVQWSPSGVYTQPQTVTDAEGTRQWQLQTATETAAIGREPWQPYMWAVWQEVV